ncbi:lasso peptide biosynthesis B2 protein [Cellulomonas sp. zg-ZUI22]|uniref:lasso peptide biosynthesis B2 protein n=1 Tax=Cellulomonas sp. zg-ZUI22 TaxID=2816955 RepID=UPI001A94202B|nr:lasso peptide biosynthesis B2 protein [Cellulomonas sp. zg-ZUI22]MBO0901796.1 lasso peptide biosynthesis B2 protein [Cellulomonas sp. zg-ZUI22]
MSAPVLAELRERIGWRRSLVARLATGPAFVLAALPPAVIRRALVAVTAGARPANAADTARWRTDVNSVSRRCAGQGCLQRSIAVVLLARLHGSAPTWRTGFRPDPFVAHAWVEADGAPVGEPPAVAHFHTVLTVSPTADAERSRRSPSWRA